MEFSSKPLVILTGKTASGKDAVMAQLLIKFPDFRRVITTTSRNIRSGEQNGVDYNFISGANFRQKIKTGDFIEYVEYAGNLYGTEKSRILDNLDHGLIWRIDPSRAGQIRKFIRDAFKQTSVAEDLLRRVLVIYLTTDDTVILERLKKRYLNPDEIEKRMQDDSRFWQEYKDNYDFVVENVPGKLDDTFSKVSRIIAERKMQ